MFKIVTIFLTVVACFAPGGSVAAEQTGEKQDRQDSGVFTGIHSKRGVGGKPNTVRITNGKAYIDVTEQEYRERGYVPPYDKLPELIIQRLPVLPKREN